MKLRHWVGLVVWVVSIVVLFAIDRVTSAQIPPQKPPTAEQIPPGTPVPGSPEGLKLEIASLRSVVQQQQSVIATLQKQLLEAQGKQVVTPEQPQPAAPPSISLDKLTTSFFATRFRGMRDVALQPCKDLGGKLRITIAQPPVGPPAVNAVCEF